MLKLAQNMVNNQNEKKNLKLTITESRKNFQVFVAKDQRRTIESKFRIES